VCGDKEAKMKIVNRMAAQGDVLFVKVGAIPADAAEKKLEEKRLVVAHSETGHHHYLEVVPGMRHFVREDPTVAYLTLGEEADVIHARAHDTHETLRLAPGHWQVRRQREYVPEGWRRVED
jgi:hypothetical protein